MVNVDEAREELADILQREEYTVYYDQSKNLLQIWWEKAVNWLGEKLADLFPTIEQSITFAEPLLFVIIAVLLVALGIVLFFLIRYLRRKQKFSGQSPLHAKHEIEWSPHMHVLEAQKQEKLQAYSAATRHMFLALLLSFHEKEWLVARIWKTNWEYYAELQRVQPQAADPFQQFAQFFDEAMYGERVVGEAEYSRFRSEIMKWLDGSANQ